MEEENRVLLQTPDGHLKPAQIKKGGSVSLGRYGTVIMDHLIGKPFGLTFEICMPDQSLRTLGREEIIGENDVEDLENSAGLNNQDIVDDNQAQRLSSADIDQIKESDDRSGMKIVEALVENNVSFEKKTEFSKVKYIKRKKEKFTALEPNIRTVCQVFVTKQRQKTRDIRVDSLGYMLSMANIKPNSRFLVADDIQGLLLAAAVSRMDGSCEIVALQESENSSEEAMSLFNFSPEQRNMIHYLPWEQFSSHSFDDPSHERFQRMSDKRKEFTLERIEKFNVSRRALQRGDFDGVLIATKFHPTAVLKKLMPYLTSCCQVVIHSASLELLSDTFLFTRSDKNFLNSSMNDNWFREYKVLPFRTRPLNEMSSTGGFVLTSTFVRPDDEDVVEQTFTAEDMVNVAADNREESEEPETKRICLDKTLAR